MITLTILKYFQFVLIWMKILCFNFLYFWTLWVFVKSIQFILEFFIAMASFAQLVCLIFGLFCKYSIVCIPIDTIFDKLRLIISFSKRWFCDLNSKVFLVFLKFSFSNFFYPSGFSQGSFKLILQLDFYHYFLDFYLFQITIISISLWYVSNWDFFSYIQVIPLSNGESQQFSFWFYNFISLVGDIINQVDTSLSSKIGWLVVSSVVFHLSQWYPFMFQDFAQDTFSLHIFWHGP